MKCLVGLRHVGSWGLRRSRLFWVGVSLAWMGFGWWLSNREGEAGPDSLIWSWISNMGHAPLFGLLAMWIALASRRVRAKNGFVWVPLGTFQRSTITAGVLLWGVIDELHQASTPGRHASFWDLLTDGVSAWMVLWVAAGVGAAGITEGALVKRLLWSAAASMTAALAATLY